MVMTCDAMSPHSQELSSGAQITIINMHRAKPEATTFPRCAPKGPAHSITLCGTNSNHGTTERKSSGVRRCRDAGHRYSRAGKWDELKLWQLGYHQELHRGFTQLNNLAIGTSVLSFFAVSDAYGKYGLAYGGPVSVIWGWVISSVFSLVVALCLAELLSAFPTSGGIYYWSWILAPVRYRTVLCWLAGWLNLLGQISFTAGLEYSLAQSIASTVFLQTGGEAGGGLRLSRSALLGVMAAMLLSHALLNSLRPEVTAFTSTLSLFWHLIAALGLCGALLATAPRLNSLSYMLTSWSPHTEMHGISSPGYIFLVGLLMSQWTIMGYDAAIHVAEETIDVQVAGSRALVGSVCTCSGLGLVLLTCLTLSLQNMSSILDPNNVTGGQSAMMQLMWDVFTARYGNGYGALGLSYIPLVGLYFCANASLCANARMAFAFSRDGAMPGARYWRRLSWSTLLGHNERMAAIFDAVKIGQCLPVNACWLMAVLALLLGVPCIYNDLFFATVSAGSVVALSLSYGIPISLRLLARGNAFIPGPFYLGRASKPLACIACFWILLISVVFALPNKYPVTPTSANYAAPLIGAVLAVSAVLFYAPGVGGQHWFTGPAPNLTD